MITNLKIKNFKSIKQLDLNCSRVNIFIGEPNTGKSNILESIGMASMIHNPNYSGVKGYNAIHQYVRAEKTSNLFYNNIIDKSINIDLIGTLGHDIFSISYINKEFIIECRGINNFQKKWIEAHIDENLLNNSDPLYFYNQVLPVRFYKYKKLESYPNEFIDFLQPPFGENLLQIIRTRENVKQFVLELFKDYGYLYQGFDDSKKIYFNIPFKNELIPLPFHMLSDTLLRLIFYYAAIELSIEATLILEEPESHLFPFYNKFLAERIALYNSNQFFIATHNPTFLANIIEQTPDEELKVFVTFYENYQTKVHELSGKRLLDAYRIFGAEMFGNLQKIVTNLDKIIEKEELEAN